MSPTTAPDVRRDVADGVVLLDKPAGVTSFAALDELKRALGTRKVGHAGTLDRFATGLLVVFVGPSTRLVRFVQGIGKEYHARVLLGVETTTLDPEGEVVATAAIPERAALEAALPAFRGLISQVPPAYSALHVDGRRAYEIARSGELPALEPRSVEVTELRVLGFEPPHLDLLVRCSGGTYVRSLARDLALAAGSRGHLAALRRTAIGDIRVEDALSPDAFAASPSCREPGAFLAAYRVLPCVFLRPEWIARVRQGRGGSLETVCGAAAPDGEVACLDPDGSLVATATVAGGELIRPRAMPHAGMPGGR